LSPFGITGIEGEYDFDATDSTAIGCDSAPTPRAANVLHGSVSSSRELTSDDAASHSSVPSDIRFVFNAWPDLAPHIREAIQTLVTANLRMLGGES